MHITLFTHICQVAYTFIRTIPTQDLHARFQIQNTNLRYESEMENWEGKSNPSVRYILDTRSCILGVPLTFLLVQQDWLCDPRYMLEYQPWQGVSE